MYSLRVTVTRLFDTPIASNQSVREFDSRAAFWSGLRYERDQRNALYGQDFDEMESTIRNAFAAHLAGAVRESFENREIEWNKRIARITFRVLDISYGSLKIELGVPDIDSLLDLVGNNSDVLEAILDEYVPQAFVRSTGIQKNQCTYRTEVSPSLHSYAQKRESEPSGLDRGPRRNLEKEDAKEKGAKILGELVRSPLVFPVLIICFLWYVARQDTLAERQILGGLMQNVMQQQTAVLGMLRDVAIREAKKPETDERERKEATASDKQEKK